MLVFTIKKRRRYVIGGGPFSWIASAIGKIGNFINSNKDTIKNVSGVVGTVADAGATTASAVKRIVDTVRTNAQPAVPKSLEKVLSEKSVDFLKQLAMQPQAATRSSPAQPAESDINSRIAGAGFKTIRARRA